MPEFLHPGVYVVEVDGAVRPIEGVPTLTTGFVGSALLARLEGLAEQIAPGWTDRNDSDPGVALLSLAAWLAETVLYREERIGDSAATSAARLAAAALHALDGRELPKGTRLRKVQFHERATAAGEDSGQQGQCIFIRKS